MIMETRLKPIAVVFVIAVLAMAIYFGPLRAHFVQQENMGRAESYIKTVLQPAISADKRFTAVKIGPYTGGGGMLLVAGSVKSQADLDALKQVVADSKPVVGVKWVVNIVPQ